MNRQQEIRIQKFHLTQMCKRAETLKDGVKILCENIVSQPQNYNPVLHYITEKLENLQKKIQEDIDGLSMLIEYEYEYEEQNYKDFEKLSNMFKSDSSLTVYEHSFTSYVALSQPYLKDKCVFPIPTTWTQCENFDSYQLLSINRAAKIELSGAFSSEILARALRKAFISITDLDYIDLSRNKLDDSAMQLLANALNDSHGFQSAPLPLKSTCEVLILSRNNISKKGLDILLEALSKHPLERHVLLDNNFIDFDEGFFKKTVLEKSLSAKLVTLDLAMNFIPRGYMFYRDNKRIFYSKDDARAAFGMIGPQDGSSLTSMQEVFLHEKQPNPSCSCSYSRLITNQDSVMSLILQHSDWPEPTKAINLNLGAIGLFAKKPKNLLDEHAFLVVEGISKFGQRYLIRADLYATPEKKIVIRIIQCSPQDFLEYISHDSEKLFCNVAKLKREKIKLALEKICMKGCQADFSTYKAWRPKNNAVNCITWLRDEILMPDVLDVSVAEGWRPSDVVGQTSRPTCTIS